MYMVVKTKSNEFIDTLNFNSNIMLTYVPSNMVLILFSEKSDYASMYFTIN